MLLKLLTKKNVKEILLLLKKEDELQFSDIQSILELHKGNLSTTLKELEKEGIVSRREEREDKRIPKAYFKLTEYGLKILSIYDLEDKLKAEKE
ncbi:MarR family transcriptional regulator [Methanococcus maripaludis]|uniref:DNA-binding HxlR family transcriptional regulator n=2 Tax=Methanococcus maripaludis TaxID=39152 RepID=A0A8T4HA08_METMI|nr:MarR family transcriptional regulator [Methanococcus maripaludis]MBM7408408.1 DNA-binding HxlR family transcriptional regulator [Methanococcus maripaludis]MBP2220078.1 DNA-binding HxlR family transcriptional regulator [Methanococcus maripaludis]